MGGNLHLAVATARRKASKRLHQHGARLSAEAGHGATSGDWIVLGGPEPEVLEVERLAQEGATLLSDMLEEVADDPGSPRKPGPR